MLIYFHLGTHRHHRHHIWPDSFLFGAEAGYNVTDGKISRYTAVVGYNAPEYAVTVHCFSNLSTFAASYYHRISPDIEADVRAVYNTKSTTSGVSLKVGTEVYIVTLHIVLALLNTV